MKSGNAAAPGINTAATNKNLVLVICSLMCFFLAFPAYGLNIAIPTIGKEFNADVILLNWVVTLSILTTGVFLLPCGRLADIIGIKKVFTLGLIIFIPFSILTIFSTSIYMLLIFQMIQAIGLSMVFSTYIAFISEVFPAKERGRALGINVGVLYFGFSISPFVCGFMVEHFGWRSIFLIAIPGCVLALFFLLWKVKEEWMHSQGEKFDYQGTIVYGLSLIALMYGFSVLPQIYGFILVVIGLAGTVFFLKLEGRIKFPVLDTSIFRNNRVFLFSIITTFISYAAVHAVTYLLSLYLQYNKGLSASVAGLVLFAQPVMQAIFSPISGQISDRIEPRIVASLGMGLTCLGLIPFAFVSTDTSLWVIITALAVLGMGFGLFSSPNTNAIMGSVQPKYFGVASASLSTVRTMGQLFSMAITMIIISVYIGRVVITPDYYVTFLTCVNVAFSIFAVLCFVGVFTSLTRGKVR